MVSASSRSDLEEVTNTLQLAKHRLTLGCAGVSKELNELAELCSRPNEDSPDQRVQKLLVSSGRLHQNECTYILIGRVYESQME